MKSDGAEVGKKNNFRKPKKMPQFFHATNLYDLNETREPCETRDTGEQWFQPKTVLAALRAAREQKVFFYCKSSTRRSINHKLE